MTCPLCNDYRFVDGPADTKVPCPECRPAQAKRDVSRRERVRRIRTNQPLRPNVAPITFVRCPVHQSKVGRDGENRLLGRCAGCAADCANGLRWLREHPKVAA